MIILLIVCYLFVVVDIVAYNKVECTKRVSSELYKLPGGGINAQYFKPKQRGVK